MREQNIQWQDVLFMPLYWECFLCHLAASCTDPPSLSFLTGPNMLNSHHLQANGDMNGGHSSQPVVSTSHCSPPPPYNPDPSLVRYLTLQWYSLFPAPVKGPQTIKDANVGLKMNGTLYGHVSAIFDQIVFGNDNFPFTEKFEKLEPATRDQSGSCVEVLKLCHKSPSRLTAHLGPVDSWTNI